MSSLDLVNFAATENHVKFRSTLNEMLYSRLSESIKEKTKDTIAEMFQTERIQDSISLEEYVSNVIHEAEQKLGTQFTSEEIVESASHIVGLLEKAKEEEKEDEDEDEDEEKEDEDEEEEDEDEDEGEEEEDEDKTHVDVVFGKGKHS